jgi:hypothetical protein
MNVMEIVSLPIIVTVVYGVIELLKLVFKSETFNRVIPLVAAALGVILGIVIFYAVPSITFANNIVEAMIIGAVSGLSATGTNQIGKQLSKSKEEGETEKTDKE